MHHDVQACEGARHCSRVAEIELVWSADDLSRAETGLSRLHRRGLCSSLLLLYGHRAGEQSATCTCCAGPRFVVRHVKCKRHHDRHYHSVATAGRSLIAPTQLQRCCRPT
jgi:hypothetical protein